MFGGVGDWPRCSYTASRSGGHRADPNTEFEITLTGGDGYQRVIRGGCVPQRPTCKATDDAPSCAEGIIRPGDEVDVRIHNTAEDGPGRVAVGDDIRC